MGGREGRKGVELGVVVMDSSPWQPTNVYKALRNFLISAGLLEPSESGSRSKQMLDIIRTLAGAGAPLPSSSFSPSFFSFFDRVGKLFFMSLLPLAVPFFSCPCLSPALSLSVLF